MTSSTAADLPRFARHRLRPARRVILLPASSRADRGDAAVRRYRLARLRLEGREVARSERFDHVKRTGD